MIENLFAMPKLTDEQKTILHAYELEAGITTLSESDRRKTLDELAEIAQKTGYRSAYLDYYNPGRRNA